MTDKRMIFVEKVPASQKMQVTSIPYSKVEEISFEITGSLSSNVITVVSKAGKHELEFDKLANIKEFYTTLSKISDPKAERGCPSFRLRRLGTAPSRPDRPSIRSIPDRSRSAASAKGRIRIPKPSSRQVPSA